MIKIVMTDGMTSSVKVLNEDGTEIRGVTSINIHLHTREIPVAVLTVALEEIDLSLLPENVHLVGDDILQKAAECALKKLS